MSHLRLAVISTFLLASGVLVAAEGDWPQYRGPNRNGITSFKNLATTIPADGPKKLWTASVGPGNAGIAVADGRVFTLGSGIVKGTEVETVYCFDALTGQSKWGHTVAAGAASDGKSHPPMPGMTTVPTIDGDLVYTLSRYAVARCWKAATGDLVWEKNLIDEYKIDIREYRYGFSSSPLVVGKMVIFSVNAGAAALDRETGKEIWHFHDSDADCGGYASPVLFEMADKKCVALTGKTLIAVALDDGKELWRVRRWQPYDHGANAADPIFQGDEVFLSQGHYTRSCALYRFGSKPLADRVWGNKDKEAGPLLVHFSTPVLYQGNLYGFNDGKLACVDFATGKSLWEQAEPLGKEENDWILLADDKLLAVSEAGELVVVQADPTACKVLGRTQIIDKGVQAPPALANGLFYCRNAKGEVVCCDLRKQ